MHRENVPGLDFAKILGESNAEFEDFSAALGRLMTRGLTRLSPNIQFRVRKKIDAGGELLAFVTVNPVSLTAALQEGECDPVKLFEFPEQFH